MPQLRAFRPTMVSPRWGLAFESRRVPAVVLLRRSRQPEEQRFKGHDHV